MTTPVLVRIPEAVNVGVVAGREVPYEQDRALAGLQPPNRLVKVISL
jgi:hypothetical protein